MKKINLAENTIDNKDIDKLIDWLKTYPRLTKGKLTEKFEIKWSELLDTKYSIFVNSGSSANLLMLAALIESRYLKCGDNVALSTLSWSTDLSPIIQLGLHPILIDCNLNDLSIDTFDLSNKLDMLDVQALLLVSPLGIPPNMDNIVELCDTNNIILLEDVCESFGSSYNNNQLGTWGSMSSFSTYFGHHLSTIEGGVISTNNSKLYYILKMLRSHGWDRELPLKLQKQLRTANNISDFKSLYTFYYPAFNLRSTDLQAFIGLNQLQKSSEVVYKRNKNFQLYENLIKNDYWKLNLNETCFVSNFAYPIIHPKRAKMVKKLQENNIEVRPLICGSLGTQPFYVKKYGKEIFPNSKIVDDYGFYVPNHPNLIEEDIKFISNIINEVIYE